MKKSLLITLATVLILSFTSCDGLKKMIQKADDIKFSANPDPLEMHNNQVAVSIKGNFPAKYFKKKVAVTITPTLVWEGGEKALTPINVEGEKVKGNGQVINYKQGGACSYNDKFDYEKDMRRSHIELRITGKTKKKTQDFPPRVILQGIVATPDLVVFKGESVMAKDKFVKDLPESKLAQFNYDKNRAELKSTETKKDDVVALKDYIKEVNDNNRKEFKGIELKSYASPEGTLERNTKVANERSTTADKYVKNEFKKIEDFKKQDFFKYLITEEDWEGFKKIVSESTLADKDMIIRVVNMNSDPEKREAEIRNMKATFDELEKVVHPQLRRSEIKVNIMLIGNTDQEIETLFSNSPEKLSLEELLYLGNLSTTNEKKLAVYTKTTELYPKDWRGFNNLAAVQYKMGNNAAAKVSVEKAKSLEANATVFNNLGNVYLAEGNMAEAETNYKSATGVPEASAGQGVIAIKTGNYKNASDFFGNNNCFNAALAKVLNKDYDAALKTIDASPEKDDALSCYLKAIIGARKNDSDMLYNNLRTACSKDSNLKKLAANDVEFIKFFENDTFKSIVK